MRFLPLDAELLKKITLDTPIELLPVPERIHYCLRGEGLKTVRDIAAQPDCFFYRIPNMGRKSIARLSQLMLDAGIATQLRPPLHQYGVPAFFQAKNDRNLAIYRAWQGGEGVASLARRFKLSKNSVYIILHRGDRQAAGLAKLREAVAPAPDERGDMSEVDVPEVISPEEAAKYFGPKLERFAEVLGRAAKDEGIMGFACIVMTERGINVVSGGDPNEEWRATLRRIAGRVADEMGQVLIARGVGRKPGKG